MGDKPQRLRFNIASPGVTRWVRVRIARGDVSFVKF